MILKRLGLTGLLVGLGLASSACTDGYGYSGLDVGYGSAGYYDPYYDGLGYAGYGGYGVGNFGWYNNFYYPGTGVYVYDRYRRPYRWNDGQRRYWESRRGGYARNGAIRNNWADFRRDYRQERRDYRGDVRDSRQALRNGAITRDQFRNDRREARRDFRGDVRQDLRQTRRENRAIRQGTPGGGVRAYRGGGGARAFRGGGGPRAGGGIRGGRGPR